MPITNTAILHHLVVTIPHLHTLSNWRHRKHALTYKKLPYSTHLIRHCTIYVLLHRYEPDISKRHRLWAERSLVDCPHKITRLFSSAVKTAEAWIHTRTNYSVFPPFHLHAFMVCCLDTGSNSPLPLRRYTCYITNVIILPNSIKLAFTTASIMGSIWYPLRMKRTSATNLSAAKLTSLLSVLHTIATFPPSPPCKFKALGLRVG